MKLGRVAYLDCCSEVRWKSELCIFGDVWQHENVEARDLHPRRLEACVAG